MSGISHKNIVRSVADFGFLTSSDTSNTLKRSLTRIEAA
jgi:hypothetical protein